ncbi:MAG: Fe-S cluster assembly protein SufD [Bauldia sp.]
MTAEVRTVRTEAETAIVEAYERLRDTLPGGTRVRERREAAIESFRRTGLPHRRIEEWKYTDLRALMRKVAPPATRPSDEAARRAVDASPDPLAGIDRYKLVLVDGFFFEALSDRDALLKAGVEVEPVANLLAMDGDTGAIVLDAGKLAEGDIAVALNAAFAADGAGIFVRESTVLDRPLEIMCISTGAGAVTVRSGIMVSAGASLKIVETHRGPAATAYQVNALVRAHVAERATLSYAKLQAEGDKAVHIGTTILQVSPGSEVNHLTVTAGAAVSRSQIFLSTGGDKTKVGLHGAVMLAGKQHADATLLIDHALPGANTRVLYKSVVDGDANGVFQGKIVVEPDAQKTDAKMMSQALLVSETASFAAKPELEIFADDVQCGHGATSGQIDETQLFYLMARGIPQAEAEQLLIEAFLDDAIDALGDEVLGEALKRTVTAWLERRGAS